MSNKYFVGNFYTGTVEAGNMKRAGLPFELRAETVEDARNLIESRLTRFVQENEVTLDLLSGLGVVFREVQPTKAPPHPPAIDLL